MKRITTLTATLAALTIGVCSAAAQSTYPNRPLTWVVPFAPGGVTDTSARVVAKVMSEKLGQTVLVENRPGAGGIVGIEYVAGLKPDGYTFVYASSGPMAVNPSLYKGKLKYDPLKSLTPVHAMAESRMLLLLNPNKPYKTFAELIAYAKKNPGKVNYGSPGSGTAQHLSAELLKAEAGIDMTHVPYKVGATQLADLMSGVLDFAIEYPVVVKPHVEAGKMVAIGMTGSKRFTNYPNIPSIAELGYP
ncbi:MAG: tripartite tricarboxylate transporter substrate binding protein, partial [Hyphomicrobiales bacterium]